MDGGDCGCKGKKKPDIRQVPFNGRMVTLRSPSSQQFQLSGIGPQVIAFEPEDTEAFEIEVRARLMSNSGAQEDFPVVRWWTETSAGNAVWKEPFTTPTDTTQIDSFAIPARGMVWRTGARAFRIGFYVEGTTSGAVIDAAVLQVSIMPVWDSTVDTSPYQDSNARLLTPPKARPFPMTAREWRVYDSTGLPFAPALTTVAFVGLNGAVFPYVGVDAALYGDWQPIPFDAVAWAGPAGIFAAYR